MNTEYLNPDDEQRLLMYVYEELEEDERWALERQLAADPLLRRQLELLRLDLARLDADLEPAMPDAGFEDRLWARIEARLPAVPAAAPAGSNVLPLRPVVSSPSRSYWRPARFALAASLVLTLVTGWWLGRQWPAAPQAPATAATELAIDGNRVLDRRLVDHLRATERVLLLASHAPAEGELAQALARELVESHRLYAAAAERAGRPRLAQALRQLEPALIELATAPEHGVDALLRQAIERDDLPFKARSTAWAVEQQMQPTTPPALRGAGDG